MRAAQQLRPLYALDVPIKQKIETVATRVDGAGEVTYAAAAERKIEQFTANGLDGLPVCIAKTPLSLSADSELQADSCRHRQAP